MRARAVPRTTAAGAPPGGGRPARRRRWCRPRRTGREARDEQHLGRARCRARPSGCGERRGRRRRRRARRRLQSRPAAPCPAARPRRRAAAPGVPVARHPPRLSRTGSTNWSREVFPNVCSPVAIPASFTLRQLVEGAAHLVERLVTRQIPSVFVTAARWQPVNAPHRLTRSREVWRKGSRRCTVLVDAGRRQPGPPQSGPHPRLLPGGADNFSLDRAADEEGRRSPCRTVAKRCGPAAPFLRRAVTPGRAGRRAVPRPRPGHPDRGQRARDRPPPLPRPRASCTWTTAHSPWPTAGPPRQPPRPRAGRPSAPIRPRKLPRSGNDHFSGRV